MRIFIFIFIVHLLLLSWQPCQDLAANDSAFCADATQQAHLHDAPQPNEEGDDCSPFCVCSCCHISTTHARPGFSVESVFTVSIERTAKIPYRSDYSRRSLNSIWQPPKFNFTA